jgi:RalA-binding protein 1
LCFFSLIESELRTKIETEKKEIERLQQEITELQYLRQDSDLEEYSSTSDSSSDSEDEEDLQEILNEILEKNEAMEVRFYFV